MSYRYKGSCHCGAIRFAIQTDEPIQRGLRCNCSICARKGAIMSPMVFDEEALDVRADQSDLGLYRFGEGTAKHYFCCRCGIYPFHETARFPGKYRVNLGCIDAIDAAALPFDLFDGRHLL